jgi:ribonuclease J
MEACLDKGMTSRNAIKDAISRKLSDFLYKKTKREPLIVPVLLEL